MAHCVGITFGSFLDCWLHRAAWLCPNQFEALKEYLCGGCASCSFVSALFIACLSSLCLVSICLLLCMENHSLLSQKKFMACTSHVSHPFGSVHVLFVALYCVKSRETYTVRRVSFRADLQLRNGVKGHAQGTRLLYSNSARVRKRSRAHTQGPK